MYAEDYGWRAEGRRLYDQLGKNAAVSGSCSAPCLGSCPLGVPIAQHMQETHQLLSRA
jgi:predicted aldo/keto reductase-like oxidoreductase